MFSMAIINANFTCKFNGLQSFHRAPRTTSPLILNCYRTATRRSGNYGPPTWDYSFIQSLKTNCMAESLVKRRDELKKRVKDMLDDEEMKELEKVELIDDLQRFGCSYHFEDEIMQNLMDIYMKKRNSNGYKYEEKDLYGTALEFRVLRRNGFNVSQEVFDCFMDGTDFDTNICKDTKGLLNLYESSFLSTEGETTLDLAKRLKQHRISPDDDQNPLAALPLHWRVPRFDSRYFIDSYDSRKKMSNPLLLEFAKLDFNMVQAVHQEDLKFMSSWWKNLCIAEELTFVRDRVVENFFWTIGFTFNPKHANYRRIGTKVNCLICTIDDVYDVYGTLDELQLFTETIERWDDVTEIGHLPEYMQLCYMAVNNFVNEVAYTVFTEHNILIAHCLRKGWVDLCKSFLEEAKWYHNGHIPTFEEYIENSWISVGCPLILLHAFFFVNKPVEEAAMNCLTQNHHQIIRLPSMIFRLANDNGTSPDEMKRGDVPKAVQCYMNEANVSINEALDYINFQINEKWKEMNKIKLEGPNNNNPFSKEFIEVAMNIARMAQCMYQYGDGHGINNSETQAHIQAILSEPIPLISRE